jgi:hypothetical protein
MAIWLDLGLEFPADTFLPESNTLVFGDIGRPQTVSSRFRDGGDVL